MADRGATRDEPEVRFVAHPRRGPGRGLFVAVAILLVVGGGLVAADSAFRGGTAVDDDASREVTPADAGPPQPPPGPAPTAPFGRVGDLVLHLPSTEALVVGYHEASRAGALGITPVGTAVSNANRTRFDPPDPDPDGTDYHVMSSRGRVLPPTSAVDVVLAAGDPVHAPVDGTVTLVRDYRLYDQHEDTRVEIRPDDAPHLRVVLIHLDEVAVRRGAQVAAGRTVLADSATSFPFSSHVDRYLDARHPHVHLEVKDPRQAD